jgi:hypothetical protein
MVELAIGLLAFALGLWAGWAAFGVPSAAARRGTLETPRPVPAPPVVERVVERPTLVERVIERVLPAPPPVVIEKTVETIREVPVARLKAEPWKAEFLSGSGRRVLGRETYQTRRMPAMSYVGLDGLRGSFVCAGKRADGVWEYRRVGVERS